MLYPHLLHLAMGFILGETALTRNELVEPVLAPAALNEVARVWDSVVASVTTGVVVATLDLELKRWLDKMSRFERKLELCAAGPRFATAKRRRELAARATLRVFEDNLDDGLKVEVELEKGRRDTDEANGLAHPTFARRSEPEVCF